MAGVFEEMRKICGRQISREKESESGKYGDVRDRPRRYQGLGHQPDVHRESADCFGTSGGHSSPHLPHRDGSIWDHKGTGELSAPGDSGPRRDGSDSWHCIRGVR